MLLHDAVAYSQTQTGAFVFALLGLCLGSEEWIVDAMQMLALDSCPGVLDADQHATCAAEGGDAKGRAGCAVHGVFRVQNQIEDDLLELAAIAVNEWELRIEVGFHAN